MSCHTSRKSCSLIAAISNKTFRADNYGLYYMLGGAYMNEHAERWRKIIMMTYISLWKF